MSIVDELAELQEMDIRLRDMNAELNDIPKRQQLEQSRLNKHKQELLEAENALKAVQAKAMEVDLEIESFDQKTSKLRSQQLELKTNKEFKAMEEEIASIQINKQDVEEKELALMEQIEKAKAGVDVKKAELSDEENSVKRDVETLDDRVGEIRTAISGLQAERDAVAARIDHKWLDRYEGIFKRKDRAVVEISNNVCGGCHMKVPPAVVHAASSRKEMVFCDFCGRLLR